MMNIYISGTYVLGQSWGWTRTVDLAWLGLLSLKMSLPRGA